MSQQSSLAAIRFGYGLPLPEGALGGATDGATDGGAALLARLVGPDNMAAELPIMSEQAHVDMVRALRLSRKISKTDSAEIARRDAMLQTMAAAVEKATVTTFARALAGSDGMRERLTTFWADHFSVVLTRQIEAILPFSLVDSAIRPHLTGNFADLLTAVTLHPAMLIYLDQTSSVGPNSRFGSKQGRGLNENLAREVIELHSMGVGAAYTQADVTEMAKLLAGLGVDPDGTLRFEPRRAEPGQRLVLGKTYEPSGLEAVRAVLRDLALQPQTAQHLARKLAVHFVADRPDEGLVAAIAAAYTASSGDLMASYRALLAHPAAWGSALQKARQPFDFIVASLRALGVSGSDLMQMPYKQFKGHVLAAMADLGQPFKRPNGPNGFEEAAEEWITPQGLARRITWAMRVPERLVTPLPEPVALAQSCLADRATESLLWAAARAEDRIQGVGLVLASAEFNRR